MSDITSISFPSIPDLSVEKAKTLTNSDKQNEAQLKKAMSGFEALLINEMLKSMWETVDTSSSLFGEDSNQAQIFQSMFNQAIADTIAEGEGIGVKKVLAKELKQKA